MALYLPRGGDYERALRYVSQANGIAGAMEGASQGLALVMNIQKIADNALNMEMKQEQFAENRAKSAADLYGRLDSLQGGLSDVVGDDGEGSVATGRGGRRAGGRAGATGGGERDKLSKAEASQLAELFNTLAQYEAAPRRVFEKRADVATGSVESEEIGQLAQEPAVEEEFIPGDWQPTDRELAGRRRGSLSEEEWSALMERHAAREDIPDKGMGPLEGDGKSEVIRALEAMGLEPGSERARALSGLVTSEDSPAEFEGGEQIREDALMAALGEMGLERGPGITRTGAGEQSDEQLRIEAERVSGPLGEGLINPAVAMGFDGSTVLKPGAQMHLAMLHERGSRLPTTISQMLGVDRDKMLAPGAVAETAKYRSDLGRALNRLMGDKEAEDRSALERSIFARLKGEVKKFNDDELVDISKDLALLRESERQKAIEDLRYGVKYDKTYALQKLKQHTYSHRLGGGKDRALELYKNLGLDLRSQRGHLSRLNDKLITARSGNYPTDEAQEKAVDEVLANIERQEGLIETTNGLRDKYWAEMHGLEYDDPRAKAPPVQDGDKEGPAAFSMTLAKDAANQWKDAGFDRAGVVAEIERFKKAGVVFEEGVEDWMIAEFSGVASEPLKDARAELEALEKKPVSASQSPSAKRERKKRERRRRSLERTIGEYERHGKELRRFTSAVDRAEEVLANLGEGRPVSKDEIRSAQQEALGAMRAMQVEYQLEPGAGDAYDRATGRRVGDDIEELESLVDLLGEALR